MEKARHLSMFEEKINLSDHLSLSHTKEKRLHFLCVLNSSEQLLGLNAFLWRKHKLERTSCQLWALNQNTTDTWNLYECDCT